ncbi:6-carboxytetrahydropterin synthase QueD [Pseudomonas sp. S 311-6]|nr:6-carboxytetrahydropterin synthase QueD [Pseudomonas sp. S 311-6]
MTVLTITRKLEFDAGHRIPDHRSQCRNLHGHRYVLEITLKGDVNDTVGASDRGMVLDFADVKTLAMAHLVSHWDHAFLVYQGDAQVREFLVSLPGHKTVVMTQVPTVENLAAEAFKILSSVYNARYGSSLKLVNVRLYETPNCWANVGCPQDGGRP